MILGRMRRSAKVFLLLFAAITAQHTAIQQVVAGGGLNSVTPNLSSSPSRLDPFNKNSEIRRTSRDIDRVRRNAGKDLSDEAKRVIRQAESKSALEAFRLYKRHVVEKNSGKQAIHLKKGTMVFRMVEHALGGNAFEINSIPVIFDAYIPENQAGVAFEDRVYIHGPYMPHSAGQGLLLAHEMTHITQYRRLGGEEGFARRYSGEIISEVRKGRFGLDMHDNLGLEREANDTEEKIKKACVYGVEFENRTANAIHYSYRMNGPWGQETIMPGNIISHSKHIDDDAIAEIRFDHSFDAGYQEQAYDLDYDVQFNVDSLGVGQCQRYYFEEADSGIRLRSFEKLAGSIFHHPNGSIEKTSADTWVERLPSVVKYRFVEARFTREFVELIDESRDISVRLFDNKMQIRLPGQSDFRFFQNGSW